MKKIDVEAHFFTEDYEQFMLKREGFPRMEIGEDEKHRRSINWAFRPNVRAKNPLPLHYRLLDLGEKRLREMDKAGIDVQVLSLPGIGCEQLDAKEAKDISRKINDRLAKTVKAYPDRFIGLAEIAPQDPEWAADELERTISELGFKGAKINSSIRGEYLDHKKYWGIFERAERLGVPISLHPSIPSLRMLEPYADYGFLLAGPTLGFTAEASLSAVRLILSGVFDQFPRLRIILGHMGEGLPFWLSRIDTLLQNQSLQSESPFKRAKKPSDYVKDNFVFTISGVFFQPAFLCAYLALGADRIAFAVDAPFESYDLAVNFMNSLPICDLDKEKIYHLNAERLFKIS